MQEIIGEKESKQLQVLLTWGSVAYGAGFLTVMAHTARLGIPVIELIKPIYIWIGFPLAIVIFSARWLLKAIRSRYSRFREEAKQSTEIIRQHLRDEGVESEDISRIADLTSDIIVTAASIIPLGSAVISLTSTDLVGSLLKDVSLEIATKLVKSPRIRIYLVKRVGISKQMARLFFAVNRFINFIVLVSLIPIGSFVYIYNLYPLIPQSYGGGRPTNVTLIIEKDNIPSNSPEFRNLFSSSDLTSDTKVIATNNVELFYTTNEEYFISNPGERIVSVSKGIVQAIIWNTQK